MLTYQRFLFYFNPAYVLLGHQPIIKTKSMIVDGKHNF